MGLLAWIILGGFAGWIASLIVKGSSLGILGNVIVGILGAFIGAFVLNILVRRPSIIEFSWGSFFVAILGSIILLALINVINRGHRHR